MLGHAFEARIYAENVPRGFLPAIGTLHHYRPVDVNPTGNSVFFAFFFVWINTSYCIK
jgi:acetyl/propionyl-CoA carboxylase alpha subunit